jgi:hypothetical protein
MKYWERFKSFKERGEWVELQFMAEAAAAAVRGLQALGRDQSLRCRDRTWAELSAGAG